MPSGAGLQTQIWNNNLRSTLLLLSYPFLLLGMLWVFLLLTTGSADGGPDADLFQSANQALYYYGPYVFAGVAAWFCIAYFFHQRMINAATGARPVSRKEAPEIYNLLENLCISRGLAMPRLHIIESDALNAFASGISERSFSITLTTGIIAQLDRRELEAVLAHELSHIRNRDVRLLMVSVIFVGIVSFLCELAYRSFLHGRPGGHSLQSGGRRNSAAPLLIGLIVLSVGYLLSMLIRFAISRRREYLADAGAVELTHDPDAMISALRKISGHSEMKNIPADVRQLFIDNASHFMGMFTTHPPIEDRIAALVAMGGKAVELPDSVPPSEQAQPWNTSANGPWG